MLFGNSPSFPSHLTALLGLLNIVYSIWEPTTDNIGRRYGALGLFYLFMATRMTLSGSVTSLLAAYQEILDFRPRNVQFFYPV